MGRRIAFRETVYFDQLTEFAQRAGWQEETHGGQPVPGTIPQDFESWHFRWRISDEACVEFIDDEAIECQLLDIDEHAVDSVEPAVRESFDVLDAAEAAQAYLAETDQEKRELLLRIIAGVIPGRPEDETVADVITDGLHSNNPMVRLAAITAAGAAGWPQFRERLEKLAAHDPDPNFQLLARNALDQHS